jgi:alpha-D-ribose 1-methylphosphonate 5-triphosphate diphosphatase PhnM
MREREEMLWPVDRADKFIGEKRKVAGNDLLHIQTENRQLRKRLQDVEGDNMLLWLLVECHAPAIHAMIKAREGAELRRATAAAMPHLELVTSGGGSNG